MTESEECLKAPNWLDNLEKLREKRVQRRLGHESGAGAPCLDCGDKCPGLDLHFWRKICKNCKCGKEIHDVEPDSTYDCIQFQLLGTKPIKSRGFVLPGRKTAMNLEFTPLGASSTVERYLKEMPTNLLPISGSEAARSRRQKLVNQLPAYDVDASLCDNLTPGELQEMEEYVAHIRQHCIGQGKLIEFPLHLGAVHTVSQPNSKVVIDQVPKQLVSSEPVPLRPSALANNLSNLMIRNPQVPNENIFVHTDPSIDNMSDNTFDKNLSNINYPSGASHTELVNSDERSIENDIANSNIKTVVCYGCNKPFINGSLAISIDRSTVQWHHDCFKCFKCNQILVDFLYFYDKKSRQIYCGRDFAEIKGIPRCGACDELIFMKEYCSAENSIFHVKHFCCWECDTPLAGQKYLIQNNNPYCLPCFEMTQANRCKRCDNIIKADQKGVSLKGIHWHVDTCFVCEHCHKNVLEGKFMLKNDKLYCSTACFTLDSNTK